MGVVLNPTCTTVEAARLLGVSAQTVQRWVDGGQLRAWKTVGGHRRIDVASIDTLLKARAAPPAPQPGRATPRVLVVDDDASDLELLRWLVGDALPDARITTATNGFEALLAIGRETPDLLVTDIVMPHMNAFEMLAFLAVDASTRPGRIIAISSYAPQELAGLGTLPRGVPLVSKPVDREHFITLARTCVGVDTLVGA